MFFHYQVKDAIPVGEDWLGELEREIDESGIFVALVGRDYVLSQWCRHELEVARRQAADGRLKIHPYALNADAAPLLAALGIDHIQTVQLDEGQEDTAVGTIVDALDRELKATAPASSNVVGKPAQASAPASSGVTALVLREDDRASLVAILEERLRPQNASSREDWVRLLLTKAGLYEALGGEDFSGSSASVALELVLKAESRGRLVDGRRVVSILVGQLAEGGHVTADAAPFLQDLCKRCAG